MVAKSPLTAEELWRLPPRNCRQELVRGRLIEMPYHGALHGACCATLLFLLCRYTQDQKLGTCLGGGAGFVIARGPDTVIAPDAAFIQSERLSNLYEGWYVTIPPDLAVEVVDHDETASDLAPRAHLWLEAGARLVWIVDPVKKTVSIHAPSRQPHTARHNDSLSGEDVLPGLTLPLADIFR